MSSLEKVERRLIEKCRNARLAPSGKVGECYIIPEDILPIIDEIIALQRLTKG